MDEQTALLTLERFLSGLPEFSALKKLRNEIQKNPSINALITQFQGKQQALYEARLSQSEIMRAMEELEREHQNLLKIPLVAQYFSAVDQFNARLNRLITSVNQMLERQLAT